MRKSDLEKPRFVGKEPIRFPSEQDRDALGCDAAEQAGGGIWRVRTGPEIAKRRIRGGRSGSGSPLCRAGCGCADCSTANAHFPGAFRRHETVLFPGADSGGPEIAGGTAVRRSVRLSVRLFVRGYLRTVSRNTSFSHWGWRSIYCATKLHWGMTCNFLSRRSSRRGGDQLPADALSFEFRGNFCMRQNPVARPQNVLDHGFVAAQVELVTSERGIVRQSVSLLHNPVFLIVFGFKPQIRFRSCIFADDDIPYRRHIA